MKNTLTVRQHHAIISRTKLILIVVIPALLPLGGLLFRAWLPEPLLKYFFFTKGLVAWTLTEYIMHRWAFHGNEDHGRGKETDRYRHHHHHTHPSDIAITTWMRILAVAVMLLSLLGLMFWGYWIAYPLGWLTGLAAYSVMHYILHQSFAVKWLPNLVRQHIWHHCKYPNKCYGITSTFWDRIFKTQPAEFKMLPEKIIRFYYQEEGLSQEETEEVVKRLGH